MDGNLDIAEKLIKEGADYTIKDICGRNHYHLVTGIAETPNK